MTSAAAPTLAAIAAQSAGVSWAPLTRATSMPRSAKSTSSAGRVAASDGSGHHDPGDPPRGAGPEQGVGVAVQGPPTGLEAGAAQIEIGGPGIDGLQDRLQSGPDVGLTPAP